MIVRCCQRLASTICLVVFGPTLLFGQAELSPPAPYPPSRPTTNAPLSIEQAEQLLQQQTQEFQRAVAEIHRRDPKLATQMVREFAAASKLIQSRVRAARSKPGNAATDGPRFDVAAREIERLFKLGDEEPARQFERQLSVFRSAMTNGGSDLPSSTEPEVHRVQLSSGTTMPAGLRTKENRLRKSYAQVHVSRSNTPVILILECRSPILWDIQLAEDVEVFAVIVDSLRTQSVMGIDTNLVLDTESAISQQLLDFRTLGSNSRGELLAGTPADTSRVYPQYVEPIVVGPSDKIWLRELVSRKTERLIEASRQARRNRQADRLPDLRYQASIPIRVDATQIQYSRGEFNVHGPLSNTLVPHQGRSLRQTLEVPDDDEILQFGITTSGNLVTVDQQARPKTNNLSPVPLNSSVFGARARIRSMTYDSKRHRLLCTPIGNQGLIAALDIASGEWTQVGQFPHPLIGIAYAPELDEVWTVAALYAPATAANWASGRFLRLNHDGTTISSESISEPLLDIKSPRQAGTLLSRFLNQPFELVAVGPYAILSGLRPIGAANTSQGEGYHFVIDAKTGELLYDGPLLVHDESQVPTPRRKAPAFSVLGNLRRLLSECDGLVQLTKDQRATAATQTELSNVRKMLRGADVPHQEPRVYVVGRYGNNSPVKLRVTDRSGPVVLVLTSNQQVKWDVMADDGVEIQKVIVDSVAKPTTSAPPGVPVDLHTGVKAFRLLSENRHLNPVLLALYLEHKASLQPAAITVLTSRQSSPSELTIGPENGAMRLKLAMHKLKAIHQSLIRSDRDQTLDDLEDKSFYALHRGRLPGSAPKAEASRRQQVYWNDFTIQGAKIGRSQLTHRSAAFACQNQQTGQLFCADLYRLYITSPDSAQTETINLRQVARAMGRITGIHFDEASGQLWIDTQTGLWSFDLATKKPTLLKSKTSQRSISTVFSPEQQRWYGIEQERRQNREVTHLKIYNQHYAFLQDIELSQPLSRGLRSFSSSYPPQLVVLGDYLAVLDHVQKSTIQRINGRNVSKVSFGSSVAVIENATGTVVHRGKMLPHIEQQELDTGQLTSLWQKLRTADERDAEPLMWQLAAGGNSALAFLAAQYGKEDQHINIDLQRVIEQLDDNRFSVREAAYRKLKDTGSKLTPKLQDVMDKGNISAEVRERLTTLLFQWQQGLPQNGRQLHEIRGIETIYRIGSDASKQMLRSFSEGEYEAHVRQQANRSLDGQSVPALGFRNPAVQLQEKLFVPQPPAK